MVKSTVVAGHTLFLLFPVGTGAVGFSIVMLTVAGAEEQLATVCVTVTMYVPAAVLFRVLLAVVPATVPATELNVAPAGETVQVYVAPAVPVALNAILVPTQTIPEGEAVKPVGVAGGFGSVRVTLNPLLPAGHKALLTLTFV